jgi:hypothetical protein
MQEVLGQERFLVEDPRQRLDAPLRCGRRETHAEADGLLVSPAEWRMHTLADGHGCAKLLRHGISVRVVKRAVENDFGEETRC